MASNKTRKAAIALTLPCLGQSITENGQYETETYKITTKVKVRDLKERLASYGQDTSGNREEVIARLTEFANDQSEWKALFHPAQKRKRGDVTGARAQSHSAKRIASMFQPTRKESTVTEYLSKHTGIDRPGAVAMSEFQSAQLDEWTQAVLRSYSQTGGISGSAQPQEPQDNPSSSVPEGPREDIDGDGTSAAVSSLSSDAALRQNLRRVENITRKLEHRIDTLVQVASMPGPVALVPRPPARGLLRSAPSPPPSQTSHVPAEDIAPENQVSVMLGEEQLTFDASQIPPPPRRHFSRDIPDLFREWETGSLLTIQGRAIPLKYWPDIYQKRSPRRNGKVDKDDAWELMKVEYGNWRYLVEEKERLGSESAFWAAHSDKDGERLQYSQILARLKSCRANTYREDAQAAKEFFGGDLTREDAGGVFTYKKGSQTVVYKKDKQIAEQWRALLEHNPVIAAEWEAMRATRTAVSGSRPPSSTAHQ
ncbi:hypothetical protein L226DRAFT_593871 [Lentinus tigrinus ALCF2SS1-7]|uniref:uncharacterized protein n=1 Tax=Lentinus tigrinus ALCF2SS1-7 TaxID=1328758 RepID=UPI001165DFDF|nr:hypothetical protein L226DRAFT_593871 [Lentinus tigrinus ALCF2SS1-7]